MFRVSFVADRPPLMYGMEAKAHLRLKREAWSFGVDWEGRAGVAFYRHGWQRSIVGGSARGRGRNYCRRRMHPFSFLTGVLVLIDAVGNCEQIQFVLMRFLGCMQTVRREGE